MGYDDYVTGQVQRAHRRERARQGRLLAVRAAARAAAAALKERYGAQVAVYLYGSAADGSRFRLDSDVDLAAAGLPADRYYEAWRVAEDAARQAGADRVDLIALENAPAWLAEEVQARGKRLT
jgi:predicted nucleotidyltransferase